jgi:hypothetical protein
VISSNMDLLFVLARISPLKSNESKKGEIAIERNKMEVLLFLERILSLIK